jgi:flagellar hook protein FlgE
VQSPDNLVPVNGNAFAQGNDSGIVTTGFPGTGVFGQILSGALEGSNVDIANELTEMIESQRIYTANSKVFQTGSDLMDVLINLKR